MASETKALWKWISMNITNDMYVVAMTTLLGRMGWGAASEGEEEQGGL